MILLVREIVPESDDWLTAAELAQLVGLHIRNPSAQVTKLKKQGLIFAINHRSVDYFLGCGLDRDAGCWPVKTLAKIIGSSPGIRTVGI